MVAYAVYNNLTGNAMKTFTCKIKAEWYLNNIVPANERHNFSVRYWI